MKPTDLYLLNQPEPYRSMLLHIIDVVRKTLPEATLEFKWTVPYFYYKAKPFCYLNVSHKHQFVDVGFAKGFELKDNLDFLIADNGRNTVKSLLYKSLEEIDITLKLVILEAKILY